MLAAPAAIVIAVPIAVAMTSSSSYVVPIAVAVPAMTSENTGETAIAIGSAAIPTTIPCVVAVNKLLALLIEAATSAPTTSLAHGVSRHADEYHETQNQNSK